MTKSFMQRVAGCFFAGVIALSCVAATAVFTFISTTADTTVAHADEWKNSDGGWWYQTGKSYAKGWKQIGGTWYYFNNNGWMKTGWQSIGGKWYYFNSSGAMTTGWNKVGGAWYYHTSSGAMKTGWNKVGSTWYYHNGSGAMLTGWQAIGGKWYYFNGSGTMQAGRWIGNYYVKNDGSMATNQWIGDYHVNVNGVWDDTKYSNPSSVNAQNGPVSLIGKLIRQERTTNQTHMGWASVDYILQLSNPVNITFKPAIGSATTESFEWLQIASTEIYLATDPNANSKLKEIFIDDFEPFVGKPIQITGTIYDSGTAHTLGSARFLDYSIKPL